MAFPLFLTLTSRARYNSVNFEYKWNDDSSGKGNCSGPITFFLDFILTNRGRQTLAGECDGEMDPQTEFLS